MSYLIAANASLAQKYQTNYSFYSKVFGNKSSCLLLKILFILVLLFAEVEARSP